MEFECCIINLNSPDGMKFKNLLNYKKHAGFGLRLIAYIIDYAFIFFLTSFLWTVFRLPIPDGSEIIVFNNYVFFKNSLGILLSCVLCAIFESSKFQATPGKSIMGLKVTNEDYGRIDFGQAFGRLVARILSALVIGFGFIMIIYTEKRQGLHDMMANTLVLKEDVVAIKRKPTSWIIFLASLLLFVASEFIPISTEPSDTIDSARAQEYFEEGKTYYKQGNYSKAIKFYKKTIKFNSYYLGAYEQIGSIYSDQKKYSKAIKYYKKLIEINPYHVNAYKQMGLIYYEQKKYSEAINCYQKLAEIYPNDAYHAYEQMGLIYYEQKKYPEAINCYWKLMEISPNDRNVYNHLGITYYESQKYSEAISCFNEIIGYYEGYYSKNNPNGYYRSLQQTYHRRSNSSRHNIYRQQNNENCYRYEQGRWVYYTYSNDYGYSYTTNLPDKVNPEYDVNHYHPDLFRYMGLAYYAQKDYSTAINYFSKAVSYNRRNVDIYSKEVIDCCHKAIQINPNNTDVAYVLRLIESIGKESIDGVEIEEVIVLVD